MRLIADVHGATAALRRLAVDPEPLLILGDLINYIDYRTNEGIVADIAGIDFVATLVGLRLQLDPAGARGYWDRFVRGREDEVRAEFDAAVEAAYRDIGVALAGATAYVTYGNVDRPDMLASHLPPGSRFVDGVVVDIEGQRIGFAGGGMVALNTPGEVDDDAMADKLDSLGRVDVLCTHVPPAVPALASDVIGGRSKGSLPILEYIERSQPRFHYFGDVHQPQAVSWRIGQTACRNVGYFRATGRALIHR
jgi:Icc-related predicted phosphoesterase